MKIRINEGEETAASQVRIVIDDVDDEGNSLYINLTHEGIIHDIVSPEGEVVATDSAEYGDVSRCVRRQEFC